MGTIIITLIFSIIFLITFILQKKFLIFISTIFTFLIGILVLVMGIINLYASITGSDNLMLSCQKDYKGILKEFRYLEPIFYEADQILCSNKCPCNFYDDKVIDEFNKENKYYQQYNYYIKYERLPLQYRNISYININNCNEGFLQLLQRISDYDNITNKIGTFNQGNLNKFINYWNKIELKFKCTGWCKGNYLDNENNNKYLYKYLFSNINNGVAKQTCMIPFRNFIGRIIEAFGILLIFQGILLLLIFIFIYSIMNNYYLFTKEDFDNLKNWEKINNENNDNNL